MILLVYNNYVFAIVVQLGYLSAEYSAARTTVMSLQPVLVNVTQHEKGNSSAGSQQPSIFFVDSVTAPYETTVK